MCSGTSGQALEQGRSSPIRGWGALEDISSQSQSPVRACDRDAPQATRSILDGLSGKGPVGMHAACASVDTDGDDGRMTPTDADVCLYMKLASVMKTVFFSLFSGIQ